MAFQPSALANLFADLPPPGAEEGVDILLETPALRLERIISHGHASAADHWYDQEEGEWVALLSGAARLAVEDGDTAHEIELAPGD